MTWRSDNATRSLFGFGAMGLMFDLQHCKHLVLYGRNIVESLMVKEAKAFMGAVKRGMRCTYRSARDDHRLQGNPLLAGATEERLRAEPRDHPRGSGAGGL